MKFLPTADEKRAIKEMKEALRALDENGKREKKAGIDWETPEYLRLNKIANEKCDKVPFIFGGTGGKRKV